MRLALLLILGLLSAATEPTDRSVRGVVADESGGVLPGVTVVARAADGHVLATTVTDGAGRYSIGPFTAGRVSVTFQLEGFTPAAVPVTIAADADAVVDQRLGVAPRSESVDVYGRAPVLPFPPGPPAPKPTPPRPRPVPASVPEHDRDSVCGPSKVEGTPESFGTVRSRLSAGNLLYSEGDELTIDGGTLSGLRVGRNFVVRRTYRIAWEPRTEIGEHSAGLVQIVSADEQSAVAVVIYACDEMLPGDRLVPATLEARPTPIPAGKIDYRHAATVLFPDAGRLLGAPRQMLVIDQGAKSGVRAGQRATFFRRTAAGGDTPSVVGDGVVVAVRDDSATVRVEHATDAIFFGDLAALHR